MFSQIAYHFFFELKYFVVIRGDSNFFIEQASFFPANDSFAQSYQGYIFLVWLSLSITKGLFVLVLLQIFLACYAAFSLLQISKLLGSGQIFAWIAPFLFFFNPISSQWIRYISTDSLFASLIIIAFYIYMRNGFKASKIFFCILSCIFLLRPNGIIYVLAFIIIFSRYYKNMSLRFLFLGGSSAIFLFAYSFFDRFKISGNKFPGFTLLSNFQRGEIIYDSPLKIPMPNESSLLTNSILDFVKYFFLHPFESLLLIVSRIFSELVFLRPWYSLSLNIFLFVIFLIVWFMGFFGFSHCLNMHYRSDFLMLAIPQMIFIGITWAIWEGRFGIVFINLFYPFVTLGFSHFSNRIQRVSQSM